MKKLHVYAVIWTRKGRKFYGVPDNQPIISIVPNEPISVNVSKSKMGRPKYRYTEPFAIFSTEKEAEAYREGNTDWTTVPIELSFEPIE